MACMAGDLRIEGRQFYADVVGSGSMVALATEVPEGFGALLNEITSEALAKRPPHRVLPSQGCGVDN